MPAVNFEVRWPDDECITYYSPSTVIHQYLTEGKEYSIEEFEKQSMSGLDAASERVRESFGYYCSAANAEQQKISQKLEQLKKNRTDGKVTFIQFS